MPADSRVIPVRLTTENGKCVEGSVVYVYQREDVEGAIGDTFRARAAILFGVVKSASRVAVVSLAGPQIVFLVEAAHEWYDSSGKSVKMSRLEAVHA